MAANKVALVTGAGTGIGKASAIALAKAGYNVVFAGRRLEPLETAAREAEKHGVKAMHRAVQTDIEHALPLPGRGFQEKEVVEHGGAVDEDVDFSELRGHPGCHGRDLCFIRDVGLDAG